MHSWFSFLLFHTQEFTSSGIPIVPPLVLLLNLIWKVFWLTMTSLVERKTAEYTVINSPVEKRAQNREKTTSGDYCNITKIHHNILSYLEYSNIQHYYHSSLCKRLVRNKGSRNKMFYYSSLWTKIKKVPMLQLNKFFWIPDYTGFQWIPDYTGFQKVDLCAVFKQLGFWFVQISNGIQNSDFWYWFGTLLSWYLNGI